MKGFVILYRIFKVNKYLVVVVVKQLNLFDLVGFEETIIERQDKDFMEDLFMSHEATLSVQESLTIEEPFRLNPKTTQFHVMDKVKIILISEEVDSETHNYRKYYEAHLIGKIGEITNVYVSTRGKVTYEVQVYGEKSLFEEYELQWIG